VCVCVSVGGRWKQNKAEKRDGCLSVYSGGLFMNPKVVGAGANPLGKGMDVEMDEGVEKGRGMLQRLL
jgi:hypothetical protein